MKQQHRYLKIGGKFRPNPHGGDWVPSLRLEGKWLAALGFKAGAYIQIQQQHHLLIITLRQPSLAPE